MRAIVIGTGSIGTRRGNILAAEGIDVVGIDVFGISNIDEILKYGNFDFGLVCTPTVHHIDHCLALAKRKIPFFCEKPLFHPDIVNKRKLRKLIRKSKKLTNMVACNMRFAPEVQDLKTKVWTGEIDPSGIVAHFGWSLVKWHNDGKHKELYSANKSMGGGVTYDVIHEIDYLQWVFGEIESIVGRQYRHEDVTVDTEDNFAAVIKFKSGKIALIHLDYLDEIYSRYYIYLDKLKKERKVNLTIDNRMYEKEMRYFIACIQTRAKCMNSIKDATKLIKLIDNGIIKRI